MENGTVTGVKYSTKNGQQEIAKAKIIIGADGKHSAVAKMVNTTIYNEIPPATCWYYSYFSGLSEPQLIFFSRPGCGFGMIPTNDGLTLVAVAWKWERFKEFRSDIEGNFMKTLEYAPWFAEKVRNATREEKFMGINELSNYFRKPFGPGWVLVGDAGYHRDPITAQGISNAFQCAEMVANEVHAAFSGKTTMEEAMTNYQQRRDETVMPVYGFTCDFAKLEPPPPDMMQLLKAIHGNQSATDGFIGCISGTTPIPEFFSPANIEKIMMQKV
jgi:flavin-dependent dehydrogenase